MPASADPDSFNRQIICQIELSGYTNVPTVKCAAEESKLKS